MKRKLHYPIDHYGLPMVFLMAYPRSGSNWLRYCFEFVTKKRTHSREPTWDTGATRPTILWHLHSINLDNIYDLSTRKEASNILLLRNPSEALCSQFKNVWFADPDTQWDAIQKAIYFSGQHPWQTNKLLNDQDIRQHMIAKEVVDYCELISAHDKFATYNSAESHLIYYEDLMADPRTTLENLIEYVHNKWEGTNVALEYEVRLHRAFGGAQKGDVVEPKGALSGAGSVRTYAKNIVPLLPPVREMKSNLDELMENLQEHQTQCLTTYKTAAGIAFSSDYNGTNVNHHSSTKDKDERSAKSDYTIIQEINTHLNEWITKQPDSERYHKYLSRYTNNPATFRL
jgi:hypothetical protein